MEYKFENKVFNAHNVDIDVYMKRQTEIYEQLFKRADDIINILIIHIRDEEPGKEMERIANLCEDEAIKVSLLEFLDIARKQRALFVTPKKEN